MYKLTNSTNIIRLFDSATIPFDIANTDYQAYLEWVAAGNIAQPYETPTTAIPTAVPMRQARLALLQAGLLGTVNAAINAGSEADKIEWEYAAVVVRNSPLVVSMATALNLTATQLDNLFILADSL